MIHVATDPSTIASGRDGRKAQLLVRGSPWIYGGQQPGLRDPFPTSPTSAVAKYLVNPGVATPNRRLQRYAVVQSGVQIADFVATSSPEVLPTPR